MATSDIKCSFCGNNFATKVYSHINTRENPCAKEKILSGEAFIAECPHCGKKTLLKYPMLVVDPDNQLILCLSTSPIAIDDMQGNIGRLVCEPGEMIEKLKIIDAGLNDIAIEMCKFVTLQELNKDVTLKFLRIDGADNEIIFTYPENGQMQMLAVGLNVYEDCCGIIARNPSFTEQKGLIKVDQTWLSGFFK